MGLRGFHCKTHRAEIVHAMTGNATLDSLTVDRMRAAVEAHRQEWGGGCVVVNIGDSAPTAINNPGKPFA